ncbi:hypothetical protein BLI708_11080 [Bifidobacterium imperatoris]|uniref:Uncharacterized protein n=1 Tax=Bifidobacterium imperatoris TaxID=2020965 RepID=A0A2N5IT79_9BIFI|nr:hypothetical protein [Bifidobacterium imperatoris]PLS25169.1 hypothetical protein Tam1G_0735 [Bifidobacterium imperatoris]QSY57717.1 hypothetical protein BLI708_11080 [Bifidobacterium imperatoris]
MSNDALPLVLIDFDGVINQFPDEKVRRRQNSTAWMKPDDPRIQVYDPANWFIPDSSDTVWAGHYHGNIRIHWAAQLVDRLKALNAEIIWLSTWQPYIPALDIALDVDWPTLHWYNPITREGRYTGKRSSVISHLKTARPIIWIDDEETTYDAGLAIQSSNPTAPVLGVGPDSRIGISRPQMVMIEQFVANPPQEPSVQFEVAGERHSEHWGF